MSDVIKIKKPRMKWRSVSIPEELYIKVQILAQENGYTNVSQFVQFYLRLLVRGDIEL